MSKVGRWITDPKADTYCTIRLDSSEKIVVLPERWLRASLDVTRLGAFVKDVQSSQTVEEVKVRCRSLLAIR
jgi:hypothetical protein